MKNPSARPQSLLDKVRTAIPALRNKKYFNFGGQGTLPQPALNAIVAAYERVQEIGPFSTPTFKWMCDELEFTRAELAQELGGSAASYALTGNVTEGCNIVLWGIDWRPGDQLLLSDSEHVGIVGAAENIAVRLKLEVTYFAVAGKSNEEIVESFKAALTPRTRLAVFSHTLWNTGQTLPFERLSQIAHQSGTQVLVDGAQSAGALDVNLSDSEVDYYAITGHKWYCGPEGIGALYIREDLLDKLLPTFVGWRKDMTGAHGGRPIDGSRFEVATNAFPLLAGFRAAMQFHRASGTAAQRANLIKQNAQLLRSRLSEMSDVRLQGHSAESGLVAFSLQSNQHDKMVRELEERKFVLRTVPSPPSVRASLHYFSLPQEINELADAIASLSGQL